MGEPAVVITAARIDTDAGVPAARVELVLVGQAAGFAALKFPGAPASASYTTGIEWLEYAG